MAEALVKNWSSLLGRIALSLIFIIAGMNKIIGFEATLVYMNNKSLWLPEISLIIAIVVELGVGLMLLVGWKTRFSALVIACFVLAATLIFHPFWQFDGMQWQNQFNHFFKNIAIIGGLLYVLAYGGGCYSIDQRVRKVKEAPVDNA
jgi:putative oxidoreductase